jgi:hypothetical protein
MMQMPISRPRLFPLEESAESGGTIFYASLETVESTPAFKVLALRGMRRLMVGLIRRAGFIAPETRDRLITVHGDACDRRIGELSG